MPRRLLCQSQLMIYVKGKYSCSRQKVSTYFFKSESFSIGFLKFASLAMALAFLSYFPEPARSFSLRKYRKRQKSHFSLSFVWIEYDLNLSDANF